MISAIERICPGHLSFALGLILALWGNLCFAEPDDTGVIVVSVAATSSLEQPDIQPGDRIIGWLPGREGPHKQERSPFQVSNMSDWKYLEEVEFLRGEGFLSYERNGAEGQAFFHQGMARIQVEPVLPQGLSETWHKALSFKEKDLDGALNLLRALLKDKDHENWPDRWWLQTILAEWLGNAGFFDEALEMYRNGEKKTNNPSDLFIGVLLKRDMAMLCFRNRQREQAISFYDEAMELSQGDKKLSILQAGIQRQKAVVVYYMGDFDLSLKLFEEVERIVAVEAPRSLLRIKVLNNLAAVSDDLGNTRDAALYYEQGIKLSDIIAPHSLDLSRTLNNYGIHLRQQGDYATAEKVYFQALQIKKRWMPDSLEVAQTMMNLGVVLEHRKEFTMAASYYRDSLALKQKCDPESMNVATALINLGSVSERLHQYQEAEYYYQQALPIVEKNQSGKLLHAMLLNNMANLEDVTGKKEKAKRLFQQSLDMIMQISPGGFMASRSYLNLGIIAREEKDYPTAADYFNKSLTIRQNIAPGSAVAGETLFELGKLFRIQGKVKKALEYYQKAAVAVESQMQMLGGQQESQIDYRSTMMNIYGETIDLLVALGEKEEAFRTFEGSRVFLFLRLLAEREINLPLNLSPQLNRELESLRNEEDQIRETLVALSMEEQKNEIFELQKQLQQNRVSRSVVMEKIKVTAPEYAALKAPELLTLEQAKRSLQKGTMFIGYFSAETKLFRFAIGPGPDDFAVDEINLEAREIRSLVELFRQIVETQGAWENLSLKLSEKLLGGLFDKIAKAHDLLFSPDHYLTILPFAALMVPQKTGKGKYQFLIEGTAVSQTLSMTLYQRLKQNKYRESDEFTIIAFGDPDYTNAEIPFSRQEYYSEKSSASPLLQPFEPLPQSRHEVTGIKALYPDKTELFLGKDATEMKLMEVASEATILHVACHGVFNELSPLDSALVLAFPGDIKTIENDGFLRTWEIFEKMHLQSNLVVLSGCQTGLGRFYAGEGLIGLTRAFFYAGTQSMMATLWSVSDEATTVLMEKVYRFLGAGYPADIALQKAQVALLHEKKWHHPWFWAGVTFSGPSTALHLQQKTKPALSKQCMGIILFIICLTMLRLSYKSNR